MQPTALLAVALWAFAPISTANVALYNGPVVPVDEDHQTPADVLIPRTGKDQNYCSPTGPDHCNFWLKTQVGYGFTDRWWAVFNDKCEQIGGDGKSLVEDPSSHSLTSQLPYTIELQVYSGTEPMGSLLYAGRETNLKAMYCIDCTDGYSKASCCRTAFQCREH